MGDGGGSISHHFSGGTVKALERAEQAGFSCAAATPAGHPEMRADEDPRMLSLSG